MIEEGRFQQSVAGARSEVVTVEPADRSRIRTVLFLSHYSPFSRVGGTELHLRDLVRGLALPRALVAYPADRELVVAEVLDGDVGAPTFHRFALRKSTEVICIEAPEVIDQLRRWVALFGISAVHVHHLQRWPISLGDMLRKQAIPYLFTAHDYYAVCPNWTLFDYSRRSVCPCDWRSECDPGCLPGCASVLETAPGCDLGELRRAHREAYTRFLAGAARLIFPSSFARDRVVGELQLGPETAVVIEHGLDQQAIVHRLPPGPLLRLAVIGNVATEIKGEHSYRELIRATRSLPVEWHFFGEAPVRIEDPALRIYRHGAYSRDQIAALLAAAGIDLCVLLPCWDETFSFVLSEAWAAEVPVLANRRGSLPERIQRTGAGVVVDGVAEALRWIERACADRTELEALASRARHFKPISVSENAQAHASLYRSLGFWPGGEEPVKPEFRRELLARSTDSDPAALSVTRENQRPRYQKTRWYPKFLAVKSLIPAPLRQLGRRFLVQGEHLLFRPSLAEVQPNTHLELHGARRIETAHEGLTLESSGRDAIIELDVKPFRPETVDSVRISIGGRAQWRAEVSLSWTHAFDEPFSGEKSVRAHWALPGTERIFEVYRPPVMSWWFAGAEIVRLRLVISTRQRVLQLRRLRLGEMIIGF